MWLRNGTLYAHVWSNLNSSATTDIYQLSLMDKEKLAKLQAAAAANRIGEYLLCNQFSYSLQPR